MSNTELMLRKRWFHWLEPRRFAPDEEALYRARQEEHTLTLTRALLLLAALGVILFSAWDRIIDSALLQRTLPVRFLCSAMSLTLWAALPYPLFRQRLSWVFALYAMAATLTIAWVLDIVQDGFLWGLSGFFYVPLSLLVLPRFRVVATQCVLLLMLVNIVFHYNGVPPLIVENANFFLGFMCLMTCVLGYLNEERDRRMFQLERELEHLANSDSLSGAFNRRYFEETAREEIARAQRYQRPLSLLMMDADHFKRINDTYGHAIGDATIRAIVETCRAVFRSNDLLARMGGEEFAVLLPETDVQAAQQSAERLQKKLQQIEIATGKNRDVKQVLKLTLSIGVTSLQRDDSVETLLQRADMALYNAKHQGRNRVVIN